MKIEEKVRGRVAVLSLHGEFDTVEVEAFEAAVASCAKRGLVRVAVSLEKLTFINSTALGVFIREHERLTQAGGDLACAALSPFASRTFQLLGMDRRIRCFPTADEAVAFLEGGGGGEAEAAGGPRVGVRFADEGEKGRERRAELLELRADGLTFRLENLEGLDSDAAFRRGRELALLLGAGNPSGEARVMGTVSSAESATGRKVVVRVAFERLGAAEAAAVARLAKETGRGN